jgi:DNA-binding PadR family transcriptional regulator
MGVSRISYQVLEVLADSNIPLEYNDVAKLVPHRSGEKRNSAAYIRIVLRQLTRRRLINCILTKNSIGPPRASYEITDAGLRVMQLREEDVV